MDPFYFLQNRGRSLYVFLFAVAALVCFVPATCVATALFSRWSGLIAGGCLMLLAIPAHRLGKYHKIGYAIAYLLNTLGNGCSVSALYSLKGVSLSPSYMWRAILPAVAVLLIACIVLLILPQIKRAFVTVTCVSCVLAAIVLFVLWATEYSYVFGYAAFALLVAFYYLCVMEITVGHTERSCLRDISFGGFGSFVILTVVVLIILSDGDVLDGLELGEGFGGRRKKK